MLPLRLLLARVFVSIALAVLFSSPALAHEEVVVDVGHNSAGKLIPHMHFSQPVVLPVSIFGPGIPGYAEAEPSFHSLLADDPSEDLFVLSTSSSVRFVLMAKDPGVEVWNDTGSAFLAVGGTYFIGQAPFDNHPIWNIPNLADTTARSMTIRLHDLSGTYTDSDPFALSFIAVPEPGSALVGIASLALSLRRRMRRI
jgi:hypothetical protein